MEVRTGWSTEFGRCKFDVTVGEGDLYRVLAEAGIDTDAVLTCTETFQILDLIAKRYSVFAGLEYAVIAKEQAVPQLEAVKADLAVKLDKVRARVGAADD